MPLERDETSLFRLLRLVVVEEERSLRAGVLVWFRWCLLFGLTSVAAEASLGGARRLRRLDLLAMMAVLARRPSIISFFFMGCPEAVGGVKT